jgi:beta-lactamase superfamily II metal-dependent hydrolase
VLLLEWERFRALLPVGLDFESQQALLGEPRPAPLTALLLAESGHAALTTAEWIAHWRPRVALLSVAAGDPDGLPAAEALAALGGVPLLRTDLNGWLRLSSDGQKLWVEVERR